MRVGGIIFHTQRRLAAEKRHLILTTPKRLTTAVQARFIILVVILRSAIRLRRVAVVSSYAVSSCSILVLAMYCV